MEMLWEASQLAFDDDTNNDFKYINIKCSCFCRDLSKSLHELKVYSSGKMKGLTVVVVAHRRLFPGPSSFGEDDTRNVWYMTA